MKIDKKCSKCNANEQILNCSFVMKLPSLLLVNTVRSPGNHLEKVIRTAIDVPQVLSLTNYLIADYDKKDEICTYILTGSINYKGEYSNSGHYVTYLFPQDSTVATYINDQTIRHVDLENLLRSKSFTTETHTLCYIRSDCIKVPCRRSKDQDMMSVLDLETIDHINKVYFGLKPNTNNFVSASDLKSCLSHSWIQDNIINCFLMNNTKSDIASFSTRFFTDIKSQRLSKEVIHRFNCDSYISKLVIFVPVHKNHNHWFVVCIFPLSKVILAVDSLNGSNTSDISIVINFFQKYLKYHHLEMSPIIWRVA